MLSGLGWANETPVLQRLDDAEQSLKAHIALASDLNEQINEQRKLVAELEDELTKQREQQQQQMRTARQETYNLQQQHAAATAAAREQAASEMAALADANEKESRAAAKKAQLEMEKLSGLLRTATRRAAEAEADAAAAVDDAHGCCTDGCIPAMRQPCPTHEAVITIMNR